MKKAKLLLTAILKDDTEYELASRMLDSFMPYFDGLAVALTGPSQEFTKLKKLIKKHGGEYVTTNPKTHSEIYLEKDGKTIFASFAAARNVSFELAEKMQKEHDYDFWSWADVDDLLVGGEEINDVALLAKEKGIELVFFTYWYSVNVHADGTFGSRDVEIEHLRERLIKPNIFKWISRLHEVVVPKDGNYEPKNAPWAFSEKEKRSTVWAHITDEKRISKALERNSEILELQVREEERKDPRTLFYLAKTYFDMNDKVKDTLARELLLEYLELSGWREERSNAREYLADIASRHGNREVAVGELHEAIKEYPDRHMPYIKLVREYEQMGLNDQADFWLDMVTKMNAPEARTTIGNPMQVKYLTASLKYNQAIRKQKIADAIYWLQIRNKIIGFPDEEDDMIKTLEEAKLLNDAGMWLHNYAVWLKEKGENEKLDKLMQAVPDELGKEPFFHILANDVRRPKTWDKKSIAYYASAGAEHFEQWSPNSLKKGIGGSETAVIRLAQEWVKKGYEVTVFGDPREEVGEHDGVMYRPWYEINWNDHFNVLILWRSPWLIDRVKKADKLFYDAHDVESQINWTDERMEKIDKVFFKSKFHREYVPKLPDEKAVVISNGI